MPKAALPTGTPLKLAQTAAANAQANGLSGVIPFSAIITLIEDIFPGFASLLSCLNPSPTPPTAAQVQATVANEYRQRKQRYTSAAIHRMSVAIEHQSATSGAGLNDHDVLATAIGMLDAVRLSPIGDIQDAMDAQSAA